MKMRIIPLTLFLTSNLLSDRMGNLSVCVNKLCLPDCICVFYSLAGSTRSADGGKDSGGIDIHTAPGALFDTSRLPRRDDSGCRLFILIQTIKKYRFFLVVNLAE